MTPGATLILRLMSEPLTSDKRTFLRELKRGSVQPTPAPVVYFDADGGGEIVETRPDGAEFRTYFGPGGGA